MMSKILEQLEEGKTTIQYRPHNGYADATRFVRLQSEIEAVEERMTREKQQLNLEKVNTPTAVQGISNSERDRHALSS